MFLISLFSPHKPSIADMSDLPKRVVLGSMVVAGIVAVLSIADLAMGIPFSGKHTMIMDILFILSAGIVGYLAWDAYKDLN